MCYSVGMTQNDVGSRGIDPDRLYTPFETAGIYGVVTRTLADWRRRKEGPTPTRLGYRTVRYRGSAILEDLDAREQRGDD